MAAYLLDSSVLIDYLRGRPDVVARVDALAVEGNQLGTSAVNVAEVFSGMFEHERPHTERLLSSLAFWDIEYPVARQAGEMRSALRRQGVRAGVADALIGAVALQRNATMLTANVRDFQFAGLAVEQLPVRP